MCSIYNFYLKTGWYIYIQGLPSQHVPIVLLTPIKYWQYAKSVTKVSIFKYGLSANNWPSSYYNIGYPTRLHSIHLWHSWDAPVTLGEVLIGNQNTKNSMIQSHWFAQENCVFVILQVYCYSRSRITYRPIAFVNHNSQHELQVHCQTMRRGLLICGKSIAFAALQEYFRYTSDRHPRKADNEMQHVSLPLCCSVCCVVFPAI